MSDHCVLLLERVLAENKAIMERTSTTSGRQYERQTGQSLRIFPKLCQVYTVFVYYHILLSFVCGRLSEYSSGIIFRIITMQKQEDTASLCIKFCFYYKFILYWLLKRVKGLEPKDWTVDI